MVALPPLSNKPAGPKHRVRLQDAAGKKSTFHVLARDQAHAEDIAQRTWGSSQKVIPQMAFHPPSEE